MLTSFDLAKFGCEIDLKSYVKRINWKHPKSQVTLKRASPSSSVCTEKGRSYSDVTAKVLTNGASLAHFADWNLAIIIENIQAWRGIPPQNCKTRQSWAWRVSFPSSTQLKKTTVQNPSRKPATHFFQDDNNQQQTQATWPLLKYSYTIIITKKILESGKYKMYNKY